MLLTFDVFCCCREKGYQSTFSFSFLFFQENGASLENKAVISASSSPLPLNSIVLPISLFRLKKIPLQVFDQEKKFIKESGQSESMDDVGELDRNKGLARSWMGAKGREGGWFLSGVANLLPHKAHERNRNTDRGGCSVSTEILRTSVGCSDLKLCVAEGMS